MILDKARLKISRTQKFVCNRILCRTESIAIQLITCSKFIARTHLLFNKQWSITLWETRLPFIYIAPRTEWNSIKRDDDSLDGEHKNHSSRSISQSKRPGKPFWPVSLSQFGRKLGQNMQTCILKFPCLSRESGSPECSAFVPNMHACQLLLTVQLR